MKILPEQSLRTRILLAYMLLAALLCGLFGAVTYVSVEAIENQMVNVRLLESGNQMIDNHLKGYKTGPNEPDILSGEQIPVWLRDASPGIHEVTVNGRPLHVLIRDYAGRRYAIVHDESNFERLELYVWLALAAACFICLLAAFLFGSATASRVIRPVTELAEAVREDRLAGLPALKAVDELGVLARSFAAKSEEMQRFLLRERLFTGDVSHELRTPLTIILGAAELLQSRLGDRVDILPVIERIRRTAVDTAERVSALLMLSRSPELVDAPFVEVAAIVEHEVEKSRPLLQGKPVAVSVELLAQPRVFGRPELIGIAVGNLIRNACQFTEAGEIRVVLANDHLAVQDTGPGVPDHLRDKLFERFVRAESDSVEGTGLGLAIVRRVCAHLGWSVELQSPQQGGSRFVIGFAEQAPSTARPEVIALTAS
jgi:signal transduction histidine kinase